MVVLWAEVEGLTIPIAPRCQVAKDPAQALRRAPDPELLREVMLMVTMTMVNSPGLEFPGDADAERLVRLQARRPGRSCFIWLIKMDDVDDDDNDDESRHPGSIFIPKLDP